MKKQTFLKLMNEIRGCNICAYHLLLPPKPVIQAHPNAALLIIAQAPGARARASGLPFDDPSGDRLRNWLGIDQSIFYDEKKIAMMPMGFCYPGRSQSGDLPPCAECAPIWHTKLMPFLSNVKLIILVGSYAQKYYLNGAAMTNTVKNWKKYLPQFLPLPHPSWQNNLWIAKNPWFESELLPKLKKLVAKIV